MALQRFESKFDKTDGCWIWNAATRPSGYGVFSYNGKPETASRISYLLYKGEIENNLHVLHTCDNPACVNPAHLFLGTNKDNVEDRKAKNRRVGRMKILDPESLAALVNLLADGSLSYRALSKQTGISRETIRRVASGTY